MTIIAANAGTYLVSAEYFSKESLYGKIVGGLVFYQNAVVGWRVREDSDRLEPITLTTDNALDREPIERAILLPDGNVETYFGDEYATLKAWQKHLIKERLPTLNAEAKRRAKEDKEFLSTLEEEDF